ncbi:hypothetical protein BDZ89DRAFT_1145788 [Hymenopellis radicata]|nr:hypothetical protein BDZ89DRAFT_1145788 [Hymenopellis radicata]
MAGQGSSESSAPKLRASSVWQQGLGNPLNKGNKPTDWVPRTETPHFQYKDWKGIKKRVKDMHADDRLARGEPGDLSENSEDTEYPDLGSEIEYAALDEKDIQPDSLKDIILDVNTFQPYCVLKENAGKSDKFKFILARRDSALEILCKDGIFKLQDLRKCDNWQCKSVFKEEFKQMRKLLSSVKAAKFSHEDHPDGLPGYQIRSDLFDTFIARLSVRAEYARSSMATFGRKPPPYPIWTPANDVSVWLKQEDFELTGILFMALAEGFLCELDYYHNWTHHEPKGPRIDFSDLDPQPEDDVDRKKHLSLSWGNIRNRPSGRFSQGVRGRVSSGGLGNQSVDPKEHPLPQIAKNPPMTIDIGALEEVLAVTGKEGKVLEEEIREMNQAMTEIAEETDVVLVVIVLLQTDRFSKPKSANLTLIPS